ncbi:DUF6878 family protein [Plastorhodobacter daqingensis]|uniref:DUF6878 family protein n=1 Tax=Plastorhodobacter daqingensis TaxID=1387281 RepID=A0ABW2UNP8_9RHOB
MTENDPNAGAPVAPASFDFADHMAQQTEYERRKAELLPANKDALFDALATAGVTSVIVTFDGSGDSGQIEDIQAYAGDEGADLPEVEIIIASPAWGDPGFAAATMTVEQAIEQLAYDFLSSTHGGWEINDGAYGEFVFDVAKRTISLDFNERYTASAYYGHEF